MPKTKDRVTGVAETARPYVDRALHDEELRDHVKQAYSAAREIYDELVGPRGVTVVRDPCRHRTTISRTT